MTQPLPPLAYATPYISPTSAWRSTIGILSLTFGSLICISNCFGMFRTYTQNLLLLNTAMRATNSTTPTIPLPIDATAIMFSKISAFSFIISGFVLILAGILLLVRLLNARTWHFAWAIMHCICVGMGIWSQYMLINATFASYQALGGATLSPLLATYRVNLLTFLFPVLIGMTYPVFLIIVFNIKSVKVQLTV